MNLKKKHIFLSLLCFIFINYNPALSADETATDIKTKKAILHALHSEDVRNIMRRLKLLIYERETTELELEKLRRDQLRLLVEETRELAGTAENLPDIASLKTLNEEERVTFTAMANQLYDITVEMEKAMDANHQQDLDAAYLKLQETCSTCHKLFRIW